MFTFICYKVLYLKEKTSLVLPLFKKIIIVIVFVLVLCHSFFVFDLKYNKLKKAYIKVNINSTEKISNSYFIT